jgi:hypothetical protein
MSYPVPQPTTGSTGAGDLILANDSTGKFRIRAVLTD